MPPVKVLVAVVVAKILPTVNWVPVAIRPLPALLAVMMALGEKLESKVMVPVSVIGLPETVKPVVPPDKATEVTVPPPLPPTQTWLMAKQPPESSKPLAKVEEAIVWVTFKALV